MNNKFIALLLAVAMVFTFSVEAMAFDVNISDSEIRQTQSGTKKVVWGTLDFDSSYPGDQATNIGGESFPLYQIGLTTLDTMTIAPSGGYVFEYETVGTNANKVVAYFQDGGKGSLASLPTYDLSIVTAVPFMAIGTA